MGLERLRTLFAPIWMPSANQLRSRGYGFWPVVFSLRSFSPVLNSVVQEVEPKRECARLFTDPLERFLLKFRRSPR